MIYVNLVGESRTTVGQPPGSGGEERLPEVICVVSSLGGAWGLYGRLLAAAERKRSTSLDHVQELLEAAYGRPLPAPGREAWVRVTVSGEEGGGRLEVWGKGGA